MTQTEQPLEQTSSGSGSFIIYTLIAIVVILLVYIGYIYNTKELVKKQQLVNEYIKKDAITFDDLPMQIQDRYLLKSQYDYKVSQLNATVERLQKEPQNKELQIVERVIEVEKEKFIEVTKNDTSTQKLPSNTKETYETYTCKTLKSSSEYVNSGCEKALKNFLEKNKDAKRFEVIGLIDAQEFHLVEKLEDVYGKNRVGNLSKYAQNGLSRQRVIEASWVVRKYVGKSKPIDTVNYTITQPNKRGFVVRAYK